MTVDGIFDSVIKSIYLRHHKVVDKLANAYYSEKFLTKVEFDEMLDYEIDIRSLQILVVWNNLTWHDQVIFYLKSSEQKFLANYLDAEQRSAIIIVQDSLFSEFIRR